MANLGKIIFKIVSLCGSNGQGFSLTKQSVRRRQRERTSRLSRSSLGSSEGFKPFVASLLSFGWGTGPGADELDGEEGLAFSLRDCLALSLLMEARRATEGSTGIVDP